MHTIGSWVAPTANSISNLKNVIPFIHVHQLHVGQLMLQLLCIGVNKMLYELVPSGYLMLTAKLAIKTFLIFFLLQSRQLDHRYKT